MTCTRGESASALSMSRSKRGKAGVGVEPTRGTFDHDSQIGRCYKRHHGRNPIRHLFDWVLCAGIPLVRCRTEHQRKMPASTVAENTKPGFVDPESLGIQPNETDTAANIRNGFGNRKFRTATVPHGEYG